MKDNMTAPTSTLHLGDSIVVMKDIADSTFDLTVTSPPYDNLRTYKDSLEWGEHVWKDLLKELYRTTKQGGVVVWVVGDATVNGSETGTSFKQALFAMECGFRLHDTMIYKKTDFKPKTHKRYEQEFEYMFVFTKGAPVKFNGIKDKKNIHAGSIMSGTVRNVDGSTTFMSGDGVKVIAEFGLRGNVWNITPVKGGNGHPAPFPEQLALDHILSWSNEGDVVFDPFTGSGTTGKMAVLNSRNFVGVEKVEDYYNLSKKRIEDALLTLEAA